MSEWAEFSSKFVMFLAEGWCIQYLFRAFLTPRRAGRWSDWAIGVFWVLYQSLRYWVEPDYFSSSPWNLLLYGTALLLFGLLWYRDGLLPVFFPVLQFTAIHELSVWAGNSLVLLNNGAGSLLTAAALRGLISLERFMTLLRVSSILSLLLAGLVREGLTFFFIRRLVRSCRPPRRFEREVLAYLFPAAAGVLTSVLIRLLILTFENGYAVVLYEKYPSLYLLLPLIALTLLAADVFSFEAYQRTIDRQEERAQRAILENQIAQMQSSLAETERRYESVRAVKHDMNNHMMVLRRLMQESGAEGEALQYLEGLGAAVERLDSRVRTGDPVGDAVISAKFQYAGQAVPGIRLDAYGLLLPGEPSIRPYDLGVILSNGLDNAIEACQRLRAREPEAEAYITLRTFRRGKMLFLEIENSFDGLVDYGADGAPRSRKEDREAHGVGLRNIRSCAQKYAGDADCIVQGRVFTLSVMLRAD